MKTTKCEECGFEISIKSNICLNCGERIHKPTSNKFVGIIKRIIFIIFALYMLLSGLNVFEFFKG